MLSTFKLVIFVCMMHIMLGFRKLSCITKRKAIVLARGISVQHEVNELVSAGVQAALANQKLPFDQGTLTGPLATVGKQGFADYQSTIAMQLCKTYKLKPTDLANKIVETIRSIDKTGVLSAADVSGPGFVNLHLSEAYLSRKLNSMCAVESDGAHRLGICKLEHPQRVVVDFSSPNIAKEMHVGHLRSTIIGDCISRVLEFQGHDVLRVNHVGDWGTQFGMLIAFLRERADREGSGGNGHTELGIDRVDIQDLVELYKAAKVRFDEDAKFRDHARQEVVRLQGGDPVSLAAWAAICAKSRAAFQEIYDLLGVRLTERGESFYNSRLPGLVRRLEEGGVAQQSEGATVVFLDGYQQGDGSPLPLIVRKSDGGYLYATTDLAAIEQRVQEERADRIIYVTDAGQAQHFAMVFQAAEKAGLLRRADSAGPPVQLQHVGFGLVLGEDGKKIKSRAGDAVKLRELLDEAVRRAEENERQRIGTSQEGEGAAERGDLKRRARAIGLGAVKYADLSMHRESSYRFSFPKMLALSGNTAPYMLYALVRVRGIQRRAQEQDQGTQLSSGQPSQILLQTAEELALAKQLVRLQDVVQAVSADLMPNKLCEYLYELSQSFNHFYEACPVLQAPSPALRASRIQLSALTADTIQLVLRFLGIEPIDKM